MTPDQLQAAYHAIHVRRQAIEAEDMALEGLEAALDRYARAVGYDLAAIVDPPIESPAPSLTPVDGAEDRATAGSRPIPVPIDAPGEGIGTASVVAVDPPPATSPEVA